MLTYRRILAGGSVGDEKAGGGSAELLAAIDRGEQPDEGSLLRVLRSPQCPPELIERLACSRWVLSQRRVLPLLLAHPRCPRHFALDGVPRLGSRELVMLANRPQAPATIRRQAERKVVERLPQLTLGERRALARLAPGLVRTALLRDPDPRCIAALLENPKLTEGDVVRLVTVNESPECLALVLRHPRWGTTSAVRNAVLRSARLPRATVLGLLATLSMPELARVADSSDVPGDVRRYAVALLGHRKARARSSDASRTPCDPQNTT